MYSGLLRSNIFRVVSGNHYSNREVDELDEQKVNFKSQPNKEKSYLCILPVLPAADIQRGWVVITSKRGFDLILCPGPWFLSSHIHVDD